MLLCLPQSCPQPLYLCIVFLADLFRFVQQGLIVLSQTPKPFLIRLAHLLQFFAELSVFFLQLLDLIVVVQVL